MSNVFHLGVKELRSLLRDPVMLVLIGWAFTGSVYAASTAVPETLNKAPIGIVDQDRSAALHAHRRCLLPAALRASGR